MSREPNLDPELISDMQLRARTERERDDGDPTLIPRGAPVIVEEWPCRGKCGALVGVDDAGLHARRKANEQLRAQGLAELGKHEIAFCPDCKLRAAPARGEANRRTSDAIATCVRELKSLIDNDLRRRSLIARLRELGHPDVDGLVRAVDASRAAGTGTHATRRKPL